MYFQSSGPTDKLSSVFLRIGNHKEEGIRPISGLNLEQSRTAFHRMEGGKKNRAFFGGGGGARNLLVTFCWGGTTEYTECQAFSPGVRIGSPAPLPDSECFPPHFGSKGGGTHSLCGREAGEQNSDECTWTGTLVL